MNTETECQVCHRLDFDGRSECQECGWPIREILLDEPIYGYDVAVQVRGAGGMCSYEVKEKHFATSNPTVARNRAKRTRNFCRVLAMRPLTEKSYVSAYGDPRDKSKFA